MAARHRGVALAGLHCSYGIAAAYKNYTALLQCSKTACMSACLALRPGRGCSVAMVYGLQARAARTFFFDGPL